jgi:hypothetical protein
MRKEINIVNKTMNGLISIIIILDMNIIIEN